MSKIVIDLSGRAGIANYTNQNTRHAYLGGEGQLADGVYNPFLKPGYLAPANATTDSVTFDAGTFSTGSCSLYDAVNDDFYIAGETAVWRGDTMSDTSLTRVLELSSSNSIKDLEIYQVNGVRKMFVVYNNASNKAEVAISSLPYDSASDDVTWLTATVSGAFTNDSNGDAFIVVADNGFAYLLMENQVHKIDGTLATGGTNGTITPNSLLFPVGFRCVDAIDANGFLAIAIHRYSNDTRNKNPSFVPSGPLDTGVFVWDRKTTVASSQDYIPAPGIREISKVFYSQSGQLRIIGVTFDGVVVVSEYNGKVFQRVNVLEFAANPVFRDSFSTLNGMSFWFAKNGYLYANGSIDPSTKDGIYKLGAVSVASSNGGIVIPASGRVTGVPAVYLTYQGADLQPYAKRMKLFNLTSQTGSETMYASEINSLVTYLPQMSVVHSVFIYCAPAASASSDEAATVRLYLNGSSTEFAAKTITRSDIARGYVHFQVNKPNVNSLQIGITYKSGTAISANSFFPMYATVDFDATTTIR